MHPIQTSSAPAAIGPYSQAIEANGFVFLSGQIALDPKTCEIETKDIQGQTGQVLQNLQAVLKVANCDLKTIIKTTIFLKNINDFAIVNQIYAEFFGDHKPARSTIEVSNLPKGALIEIDCIAVK